MNCAAARVAATRLKNHPLYKGLTKNGKWTGEIRTCLDIGRRDILEQPLHLRNPRMIFPCFMGDLFNLPFEFIAKVFNKMFLAEQHTYQVLTKHPKRALEFMTNLLYWCGFERLPNLWLGVSVENQKRADERIPILLQIPAAMRYVSFEPMVGKIQLIKSPNEYLTKAEKTPLAMQVQQGYICDVRQLVKQIHWVIIGCESGPKRRPCKLEWVRDLVRQCKAAGVAVFVKQLSINGKVSHNPAEWPEDLRLREWPK